MTRMTTDVEALAQLLQQGLLLALDEHRRAASAWSSSCSCSTCAWPSRRSSCCRCWSAVTGLVPARLAPVVPAGPRRHLDRQRRAAGERRRRARHAVARAATTTTPSASPPARREYRDARLRSMQLMSIYFAGSQLLSTVAKALMLWYGARLIGAGHADVRPADRLPALPRPVLLAAAAALGGVRPVDPGPRLARPPRRAARHADVDARAAPTPIEPGRRGSATSRSRASASPTRRTRPRRCAASTCEIAPGERVALVGTTGAGKSTFVKLVARFYDPTGGRVLVDGIDLRDVDLHGFRRHLGYVPQEPFLFSGTIRSNIAYGRPDASDLEVERAARAVGAHDLVRVDARRLPHAGGRDRPLAVGRPAPAAVPGPGRAVDPSILILDEATSNLDLATEAEVQRAMNLASQGRTTLLIAHRLQTARHAVAHRRRRGRAGSSRTAATTSSSPPAAATPSCGTPSTRPRRPRPSATRAALRRASCSAVPSDGFGCGCGR